MSALVSVTLAPALMAFFVRGRIRPEHSHPVSRALIAVYRPFAWVALRNPKSTVAIGLAAMLSAVPMAARLGHEFMPSLQEGDMLYMPTTFPNLSIEEAKKSLQIHDQLIRSFPEVERVFGKAGRSNTPTDPAPLSMVETVVKLKPRDQWRMVEQNRWWSGKAPARTEPALRVVWPDSHRLTWDELVARCRASSRCRTCSRPSPANSRRHAGRIRGQVQRADGSWLLDGLIPIPELKDRLGFSAAPEEELGRYNTLSGMMMLLLGRVPSVSDAVEWQGWRFEIVDMDKHRIDKVLASLVARPIAATDALPLR